MSVYIAMINYLNINMVINKEKYNTFRITFDITVYIDSNTFSSNVTESNIGTHIKSESFYFSLQRGANL